MSKKGKKDTSILDESIVREIKKNRIFSKTRQYTIPEDKFKYINDMIAVLQTNNPHIKYLYIMDTIYSDGMLNFLITASDSSMFVINDDDLFNRLRNHVFSLTGDLIIKFVYKGDLLTT